MQRGYLARVSSIFSCLSAMFLLTAFARLRTAPSLDRTVRRLGEAESVPSRPNRVIGQAEE